MPCSPSLQHPGRTLSSAGWALGTGEEEGRGSKCPGTEKQQRGARARLPARPPFASSPLEEAVERAGAVPGVGGLGGEEAGPPHWLLPAPPALSQRERSLGQLRGAGAEAQRRPTGPRSQQLQAGRCHRRRTMGAGAAAGVVDGPRPLLLLLLLVLGVSASGGAARSLSWDRNPRGLRFPPGKRELSVGVPDTGRWREGEELHSGIHGGASRVLRGQRRP